MTTMDVQMKQAQRATRGRTPGHATNGSAGAAAPSSTGEPALEAAGRRANAGPHAASLASLQSVVAQRACADCEHVRQAMGGAQPVQRAAKTPNGLPDGLRAGLENISGRDLSGVTVNYDSPKPAQLNAHAFAQGSTIHVAPGQEKHLPHEGWHAVQQMQNRVRPTTSLGGTPVNDDAGLEREAEVMGARALAQGNTAQLRARPPAPSPGRQPVQRVGEETEAEGIAALRAVLTGNGTPQDKIKAAKAARRDALRRKWERLYLHAQEFLKNPLLWKPSPQLLAPRRRAAVPHVPAVVAPERREVEPVHGNPPPAEIEGMLAPRPTAPEPRSLPESKEEEPELEDEPGHDHDFEEAVRRSFQAPEGSGLEQDPQEEERKEREPVGRRTPTLLESEAPFETDPDFEEAMRLSLLEQRSAGGGMESLEEEKGERESVSPVESGIRISEAATPGPSRQKVEDRTRLGFEIETGTWFTVQGADLRAAAPGLVNRTLASTDLVEFVIDDVQDDGKVQGEFRTRPLARGEVRNPRGLLQRVKEEISSFPLAGFTGNLHKLQEALRSSGWQPAAELDLIGAGLLPRSTAKLVPEDPQHVTHSVPLAAFLKLPPETQDLLLPGSRGIRKLDDLLMYFYKKVQRRVEGSTIKVTTKGRTSITPNLKTGLDALLGLLDPTTRARVMKRFGPLPSGVSLGREKAVPRGGIPGFFEDPGIRGFEDLPAFPEFNPQPGEGGRGFLSAEEKLKPPLFDTGRRDVRVLVEHRADPMVAALNSAARGRTGAFDPYLAALRELDSVQGDNLFARWFPDSPSESSHS